MQVFVPSLPVSSGRIGRVHPQPVFQKTCRVGRSNVAVRAGIEMQGWNDTESELTALSALRSRMESSGFTISDDQLIWFLRDRKLDVTEAEQKLTKTENLRKEFQATTLTAADVATEAATGKAYVHTHSDKRGRPVLVVVAAKHIAGVSPAVDSQKFAVYLLEEVVGQLKGAGVKGTNGRDAETFLAVFDMRGFGSKNADMDFIGFIVNLFFNIYPKRVGQVLLIDAPFVFKPVWALIKPLLGKYSSLVQFEKSNTLGSEYFTPSTMPKEFQ